MENNLDAIEEDGITYVIVDTINIKDNDYVYLSEINNPKNFCIRKVVKENNEEYYDGLDNNNEFDLALLEFTKKHNEKK